jgi:hypothetical protein
MGYYVRILALSEKIIPFGEIVKQGNSIKLVSGTDTSWIRIEIYEPEDNLISILDRDLVAPGSSGEETIAKLKESINRSYPVSAREWLRKYFSTIKAIYSFQLNNNSMTAKGWPTLGRIQNLLKDLLGGIIQADNEGFYNEEGDYILWQMYAGATGTIPAATLDENGEWISYQLKLNDEKAIDLFKQGLAPPKGFLNRLVGR